MFKVQLTLIILLLTGTTTLHAQSAIVRLKQAQQQRFTAMIQKDTVYLRQCTDTGLVYIHSNGLIQRQPDFIASVGSGSIVYQAIQLKEQQVRVYKKAAVINGIVHVKGIINGNAFEIDLRYTDVYVYKRQWIMVSWQSLKL